MPICTRYVCAVPTTPPKRSSYETREQTSVGEQCKFDVLDDHIRNGADKVQGTLGVRFGSFNPMQATSVHGAASQTPKLVFLQSCTSHTSKIVKMTRLDNKLPQAN